MKKNLVSTLAIIAAATAVFGMTASADDVKTAEIVLEAENAPYTYEDDNGEPAGYEYEVSTIIWMTGPSIIPYWIMRPLWQEPPAENTIWIPAANSVHRQERKPSWYPILTTISS